MSITSSGINYVVDLYRFSFLYCYPPLYLITLQHQLIPEDPNMYSCLQKSRIFWCLLFTLVLLPLLYGFSAKNQGPDPHASHQGSDMTESLGQGSNITNTVLDVSDTAPITNPGYEDLRGLLSNTPPQTESTHKRMPNVIFAMADDLGWGDVQYNNGNALTPNLNEMAHSPNTVLLQRYYSGGPVCSPTRGTVLTGRNHNRYCVWAANTGNNDPDFAKPETMPLPLSEITVAEVMRDAGYSTALFGKWRLGDFKALKGGNKKWPVSHPGLHGFDEWQATERSAPMCTLNCGCFTSSTCVEGHYNNRPPCTNYYTNKSNNIKG